MKTTVYIGTSLDGFIARKDGDINWLVKYESEEVHQSYAKFIGGIDAIVIGRRTFEKVLTYPSWPYEKKVFVLSTSLRQIPETLQEKMTILSMKPKELLKHLRRQGFSNLYIDGGKVIQGFLKEDCIDEMIITIVPELIGSGIRLFSDVENDLQFAQVRTNVFSNGLVQSHYQRKRN